MPGKPPTAESTPPDPKRRGILGVSLGLNLLLLIVLAGAWIHRSGIGGFGGARARGSKKETSLAAEETGGPGVGAGRPKSPARETPWSRLKSEDPRIFAANLRNAGCPEQTVCDLVRPVVDRWFDGKRREIGLQDPYWVTGRVRTALREKNEGALRALADEKVRMIHELPCGFAFKEGERNMEMVALVDFFSGFLGPAKQEALLQMALEQSMRKDFNGGSEDRQMGLPEDLQAERAASDAIRARLDQILTRNERAELDLRLSVIHAFRFDDDGKSLEPLHLTVAELREFVRIKARIQGSLLEELFRLDQGRDPSMSPQEEVGPALKTLLGTERYAQFEKSTDAVYRRVQTAAKLSKLPVELADQTYAIVSGFDSELIPMRAAWETHRDEALRMLTAWRTAQRNRLNALLSGISEDDRKEVLQLAIDEVIRSAWRKP